MGAGSSARGSSHSIIEICLRQRGSGALYLLWKLVAKEMCPVKPELLYGVQYVVQRAMTATLRESTHKIRTPSGSQFLDTANIQITVVKKFLQSRHVARQKPAILADTVPA